MSRVYDICDEIDTITENKTLCYIECPSDMVIEVRSAMVAAPDENTNEQLHYRWERLSGTFSAPTGTTITPAKRNQGDPLSSATVRVNVSAANEPSYDANSVMGESGASSLGGYYYDPDSDGRITIPPGEAIGLRLITAPASSMSLTLAVEIAEIG